MWTCYCGHENDGAFCASCGAPAPVTPAAGFPTRRQICETARKRLHDQHYASNCTYLTLIGTQTLSTGVVVGITYFVVLMSVFFTAQPLVLTFRGHSFDPSQYLLPFLTLYLEVMLILLLYQVFFANVLACGESAAALTLWRGQALHAEYAFCGFSDYKRIMTGRLYHAVISFLWLLIPVYGLTRLYSYLMVPFILINKPQLSAKEAMSYSRAIMLGYRWKYFCLRLSFIGWHLLNSFTYGILGIFYVYPYYDAACAGFYEAVVKEYDAKNVHTEPSTAE